MKRAKKQPRRAAMLAISRERVMRAAEIFAECLGVPVGELLRASEMKKHHK